jgi:hypothetical protein
MSWLPHPSTWGKKNQKPPSLILHSGPGLYEISKAMGVNVEKDENPSPLFDISVTPTPLSPRKNSGILNIKLEYGRKTEDKQHEIL